ncbi:hypothetical protein B9J78_03740 [bacterium Unc6]|nr:hypothetical protein [bacterium Unc6]
MIIKKNKLEQIVKHSRREYPRESCGILAGKEEKIEKIYQMENISDNPATCYFMDPKEQLKVFKEMRNLGLEMVGIYHSHLDTEAYPSAHDVELAYYPDASYVIASIKDKENPSIRSFRIVNGEITEEEIELADS